MKLVVVVGGGSIGKRHIANLRTVLPKTRVGFVSSSGRNISAHKIGADFVFESTGEAVASQPDFAIIASPAALHIHHALPFAKARIPLFIEKPLSHNLESFIAARAELEKLGNKICVGYNLRLLGSAIAMKSALDEMLVGTPISVLSEVGQYLPSWRPETDYRQSVTAQRALGGGVLLELSHEFDYLAWFFGPYEKAFCSTSNSGILNIDVEDNATGILIADGRPTISFHLDLLQRTPTRKCKVIGSKGTLLWDILQNKLNFTDHSGNTLTLFDDPKADRNKTYIDEIKIFVSAIVHDTEPAVSLKDGEYILQLEAALRQASISGEVTKIEDVNG